MTSAIRFRRSESILAGSNTFVRGRAQVVAVSGHEVDVVPSTQAGLGVPTGVIGFEREDEPVRAIGHAKSPLTWPTVADSTTSGPNRTTLKPRRTGRAVTADPARDAPRSPLFRLGPPLETLVESLAHPCGLLRATPRRRPRPLPLPRGVRHRVRCRTGGRERRRSTPGPRPPEHIDWVAAHVSPPTRRSYRRTSDATCRT